MGETLNSDAREGRPLIVIDDDDDLRSTIVDVLRAEGFEAHPATNGREALALIQRLRRRRPILLLDLVMPQLDGLTLLEHLKQHVRDAQASIVVMSASHLRPPSGYTFLRKPFTTSEFLLALAAATRDASSAVSSDCARLSESTRRGPTS